MTEPDGSTIYEFGDFSFDAKCRRLYRREDGETIALQPKAAELLSFLLGSGGRVLTKNEILEAVWENSFVEEANLSQTIFVLRKALGETSKEPRYVLTVPNRGYRFIAQVAEVRAEGGISEEDFSPETPPSISDSELQISNSNQKSKINNQKFLWLAAPLLMLVAFGVYWFYPSASKPASVRDVKSIAVLPFEELGDGEQTERYLGDGLSDALTNKLSGLKQIAVRPSRTVARHAAAGADAQEIGRDLRVDAVLDGRVQRTGSRVRVSVQLVRTADNRTIWTENFDEDFSNLFAVQDSISRQVVESLAVQLDPNERRRFERLGTENAAAYEEFLRGRFFWNKRTAPDFERAIAHFNRAIELDPNFAQAHSALAETYVLVNLFGTRHDPNAFPTAKNHATRALQLDDQLAEAHAALAQVKMQYDFDWAGTEEEYKRAIELDPNSAIVRQWYGEFLALQNRADESLPQVQRAVELDPTSLSTNNAVALALLRAGETDKALAATEKVLEMDANFPFALHYRCRAFLQKRDFKRAVESCERAVVASDESIFMKANLAAAYARAGREAEARRILAELETASRTTRVSPYNFAMIHSTLGDRAAALKFLNQAVEERDFLIPALKGETSFQNLFGEPQFAEILRRVNF